jgi:hypothetical protein
MMLSERIRVGRAREVGMTAQRLGRGFTAALAAVLATLLLPVALLSGWVAGVVTDTDRYVATVAPLATDPVVQRAAIRALDRKAMRVVDRAAGRSDLERYLEAAGYGDLVVSGSAAISAAARDRVAAVVHLAVRSGVGSPGFARAWRAANRSAHEELVAVLEGDDRLVGRDGRVSIELGTVLNTITASLVDQGLIAEGSVPEVRTSFNLVRASDLRKARGAYGLLDAAGFWLPVLWLVAVVLAVVASTGRRRTLRRLAVGSLVGVLCLAAAAAFLRHVLTSSSPDPEVTGAVWDVVTAGLIRSCLVAGAVAAVVLAGSFVLPSRRAAP